MLADSKVQANGSDGGEITMYAETGTINVSGEVSATGAIEIDTGVSDDNTTGTETAITDTSVPDTTTLNAASSDAAVLSDLSNEIPDSVTSAANGLNTQNTNTNVASPAGQGKGGDIVIVAENIAINQGASIDASGTHGGGEILIGGDVRGESPDAINQIIASEQALALELEALNISNAVSSADAVTETTVSPTIQVKATQQAQQSPPVNGRRTQPNQYGG